MVYLTDTIPPKRKLNAKHTDRMEALSNPTKASREGIRREKSQRRTLSPVRSTRVPRRAFYYRNEGGKVFMILPVLVLLRPPR